MKRIGYILLILLTLQAFSAWPVTAQSPEPVIRITFYWMEGCPNCEDVLKNVLPPLQQSYSESLQLDMIELVSVQDVDNFYAQAAKWGLPKEKTGVPLAIIGGKILAGKDEITEKLPALVAEAHAAGGSDALGDPSAPALAEAGGGLCLPETPCTSPAPDAKTIGLLALGLLALLAGGFTLWRRRTA
jgi:hypothetical protein